MRPSATLDGVLPEPETRDPGTSVSMLRAELGDIPQAEFPEGFSMRPMRADEAGLWTDVQRDAEQLFRVGAELFEREFGDDPEAWHERCFFIVDARDIAVGTISAWYSPNFLGQDHGRIHWFAIRPAWQGKRLARPALSHAMNVLARHHERAWLATSIERVAANKLYLDYGFVPLIQNEYDERNWRQFREVLKHPGLGA